MTTDKTAGRRSALLRHILCQKLELHHLICAWHSPVSTYIFLRLVAVFCFCYTSAAQTKNIVPIVGKGNGLQNSLIKNDRQNVNQLQFLSVLIFEQACFENKISSGIWDKTTEPFLTRLQTACVCVYSNKAVVDEHGTQTHHNFALTGLLCDLAIELLRETHRSETRSLWHGMQESTWA